MGEKEDNDETAKAEEVTLLPGGEPPKGEDAPCCTLCFGSRFWCCLCCVLPIFLVLLVLAFILWPRCLTVEPNKGQFEVTVFKHATLPKPSVEFGCKLQVDVDNSNLWGLTLETVKVDAMYRDVVIGNGLIKDFKIPIKAKDNFEVLIKPAQTPEEVLAASKAATYYVEDCKTTTSTWMLDLLVTVSPLDSLPSVSFKVPMPVPCANVVLTKAKDWPGASSFMGKDEKKCLIPGADSADNAE